MKKSDKADIVITSASRTAVGSLGRSLKNIAAKDLGAAVITAINNSKIKKDEIDEIIFGQVLTGGSGQNTARQAAMKAGIPKKPAFVVNQVCGSGIRSVASGFKVLNLESKNYYSWRTRKYVLIPLSNSPERR